MRRKSPVPVIFPFEYVVLGKPYSHQNKTRGYCSWHDRAQAGVAEVVDDRTNGRGYILSDHLLRAEIVWMSAQPDAEDLPDVDNVVKPLLDALENLVILNDSQFRQIEVVRIDLNRVGLTLPTSVLDLQDDPLYIQSGEVVWV